MKKRLWIGVGLVSCFTAFAAEPTMKYTSQPSGTVYSLPASFTAKNLAPVPQKFCSPTLSSGSAQATCSGLPVCSDMSASSASSFSCSVTTNCSGTAAANGACKLSLHVTKSSTLPAATKFNFTVHYGSYETPLTSNAFATNGTNPPTPSGTYRTITFKNSCNYKVWFGSITGVAPSKTTISGINCSATGGASSCSGQGGQCFAVQGSSEACYSFKCSSDNDCMTGSSCYAATGKCYWNNPVPSNGSFQLSPGSTNSIKIPEYKSNGVGVVWSGAFGGRTGCTSGSCTSALCTQGSENAEGVCSLGTGFQQPATQAEPTFITYYSGGKAPVDAYDVTTINGVNVPMSMYVTGKPETTEANPYTCGAAGYNKNTGSGSNIIGASSWTVHTNASSSTWPGFGTASVAYQYVNNATSTRCSSNADCTGHGGTCGLTYSSSSIGSTTSPGSGYLVCGTFAGWLTADQVCGTNNNFTNVLNKSGGVVYNFSCSSSTGFGSNTMADLYQCIGGYNHSCYTAGQAGNSNCCGCANWNDHGITLPPAGTSTSSYVQACLNTNNTNWTGGYAQTSTPQVYDTIYYLKKSCPSCYTYPFDDESSSFTCGNGSTTKTNSEDYTVEFCPGGAGNSGFTPS